LWSPLQEAVGFTWNRDRSARLTHSPAGGVSDAAGVHALREVYPLPIVSGQMLRGAKPGRRLIEARVVPRETRVDRTADQLHCE
jgi:hypothetical protein